jgi:hypothetical protein
MPTSPAHTLSTEHLISPRLVTASSGARARRHGLLTIAIAAIREAGQRRFDREFARFIASHGGELTDDLEREISRRFGYPAGAVR